MLAQGDADDVVPPEAVLAWAANSRANRRLHVLAGAGHFFHGKLHELKPLVSTSSSVRPRMHEETRRTHPSRTLERTKAHVLRARASVRVAP